MFIDTLNSQNDLIITDSNQCSSHHLTSHQNLLENYRCFLSLLSLVTCLHLLYSLSFITRRESDVIVISEQQTLMKQSSTSECETTPRIREVYASSDDGAGLDLRLMKESDYNGWRKWLWTLATSIYRPFAENFTEVQINDRKEISPLE